LQERFSLATQTANPSIAMGSMPASRKVSRTKRWRSFSAFKATSVTAANSVITFVSETRSIPELKNTVFNVGNKLG